MPEVTSKTREMLADMFLKALDEDRLPWQQPWDGSAVMSFGGVRNAVTDTPYRNTNALLLWVVAMERGYSDERWCTYKQAEDKGWSVKKGEKGVPLEFWSIYDKKEKKTVSPEEMRNIIAADPTREKDLKPLLRNFFVFNATQIDGIPPLEKDDDKEKKPAGPVFTNRVLEEFSSNYLGNENIKLNSGASAFYSPAFDSITMPPKEVFRSELDYYDTLFHEMAHSTQKDARLNRDASGYGKRIKARAHEELVAEMAGAFITSEAVNRVPSSISENNIAYIQDWASEIKDNKNLLVDAIKKASAAADFVCASGRLREVKEKYRDGYVTDMYLSAAKTEPGYAETVATVIKEDGFYDYYGYNSETGHGAGSSGPYQNASDAAQDVKAHCPDAILRIEKEVAEEIRNTGKPNGKFYVETENGYLGVESLDGSVHAKEFRSQYDCVQWVNGKERNMSPKELNDCFETLNRLVREDIRKDVSPRTTLERFVDIYGDERAFQAIASLVNSVHPMDERIPKEVRDWAKEISGAYSHDELIRLGLYTPDAIHPSNVGLLGGEAESYQKEIQTQEITEDREERAEDLRESEDFADDRLKERVVLGIDPGVPAYEDREEEEAVDEKKDSPSKGGVLGYAEFLSKKNGKTAEASKKVERDSQER